MSPSANEAWLLIGNPENRRLHLFQQALAQRGLGIATILSYEVLLQNTPMLERRLMDTLALMDTDRIAIRIDSPGENLAVEHGLIRLGYEDAPRDPPQLSNERGEIADLRYWYRGFKRLLMQLKSTAALAAKQGKQIRFMNQPDDIALMFDKQKSHAHLFRQGLSVIPALPKIASHHMLRQYMLEQRCHRVFVKSRYGSSASGVIAYEIHPDGKRQSASTSVELVCRKNRPRLYNSLKPRKYTHPEEINQLMEALFAEDVHIEQWLPKSRTGGLAYDLRVMAIGARAAHSVVRKSKTPMTNLHLGNQRGELHELDWDKPQVERLEKCVSDTAAAFPDSHYMGIDLLLPRGGKKPRIIEVNAFGDLLPGIQFQGRDSFGLEIDRWPDRV
jgi:glutathione synthase/RimK-type ligase-like ATP-grasp enzyme